MESSKRFIKITFEQPFLPVDLVAENKNRTVGELLVCQQGLQLALGLFESSPEQEKTFDMCANVHLSSTYASSSRRNDIASLLFWHLSQESTRKTMASTAGK